MELTNEQKATIYHALNVASQTLRENVKSLDGVEGQERVKESLSQSADKMDDLTELFE